MKLFACAFLAVGICGLGCADPEPTVAYKPILGGDMVHIWIQAAGETYDGDNYKATLNSCFETNNSQGKCGLRIVNSTDYYQDSVSVSTNAADSVDHGKTTVCDPIAGAAKYGNVYEMVCDIELVSATPEEVFLIDVNNEGTARITMPIWPNPDKDYLSISLPVIDQNVHLSTVSDALPLEITWDADMDESTSIEWTISNLDTDPACKALDYSQMHDEGLSDSGLCKVKPSIYTYPTVVVPLPIKGCAALLTVTRVLEGGPIVGIGGTVEARVVSERPLVIFE